MAYANDFSNAYESMYHLQRKKSTKMRNRLINCLNINIYDPILQINVEIIDTIFYNNPDAPDDSSAAADRKSIDKRVPLG